MTDKQELIALASAVEKLEGPCRETDAAIYDLCGDCPPASGTWPFTEGSVLDDECLRYTASIDAAMTLVPSGLVFNLGNDVGCWAYAWHDTPEYNGEPHEGRSATPALALCAAALRARASITRTTGDGDGNG